MHLWACGPYGLFVALKRHMKDPVLGHKGVMWRPKGGSFNNRPSPSCLFEPYFVFRGSCKTIRDLSAPVFQESFLDLQMGFFFKYAAGGPAESSTFSRLI